MTTQAVTATLAGSRADRYRRAEQALWDHYGLEPIERYVEIESPRTRIRVNEVGSGEPMLFVPGTPGTGPYWGALVRELAGFRCLLLDRPGCGLSAPIDYSMQRYKTITAEVLAGVLDALGVERAHIVGHSIGNVWALRLAKEQPARVASVVLAGGGPVAPDVPAPRFIKLLASPLGAIIVRLPVKPDRVRSLLRDSGHGASLDAGGIPDAYVDWAVSFLRDTDSMRNERGMVRSLVSRTGWRPGLTFDATELGAIKPPLLWLFGTADPVGSVETWSRVAATMPDAELRLVDGAGHLPWLDDPELIGREIRSFLRR